MPLKAWKRRIEPSARPWQVGTTTTSTTNSNNNKFRVKVKCSEDRASFLSRIFFCWVTPLLIHGWHTPVELDNLPEIGISSEMDSAIISANFHTEWAKECRRALNGSRPQFQGRGAILNGIFWIASLPGLVRRFWTWVPNIGTANSRAGDGDGAITSKTTQPSLICALYPLVSGYLARALIARLITELIPVFIPILVKLATSYAHHKRSYIKHSTTMNSMADSGPPSWHGYLLVVGIFAMLLLYSWSFQWFFYEVGKATIIVRTALISSVYRKSLVLSSQARSEITVGKLTNLVSSDIGQIERGVTNMLVCLTIPIQVIASVIVLIYMIGPTGVIGWALVIAFVPVQMWASQYLVRLRGKAIRYTDKRILATREALQGMRIVKFFVWENTMLETIQQIRSKEIAFIAKLNLARYGLISFALHSPVFASVLTFAIYVLTGGKLKTGPVFAVIGIFNSMSVPLSWLPGALTETRNTFVPLQRIADTLLQEELVLLPQPQPTLDVALRVSNGSFAWKSDHKSSGSKINLHRDGQINATVQGTGMPLQKYRFPDNLEDNGNGLFCLTSINLEIPHGSLVAIIGSVGSGKSSFMSALVGEMKCVSGRLEFGGTISYAPQTPWVMNSSVRDNILFGLPYDKEKYINVIEACALDVDFATFAAGDMTEIGERGVTLSGGQKQRVSIARAAYSDSDIVLLDDCLSAVDTKVAHTIFKHCIKGFLAGKTCIVVTNNLELLPSFNAVITLQQGRVVEQGSFANLMALEGITASMFSKFVNNDQPAVHSSVTRQYNTDSSLHTATPIKNISESSICEQQYEVVSAFAATEARTSTIDMNQSQNSRSRISTSSNENVSIEDIPKDAIAMINLDKKQKSKRDTAQKLMSEEERATGQISLSTYVAYIQASGGVVLLGGILACLAISQGCRVGGDFWIRLWVRHKHNMDATSTYIWVYALLGGMQFIWFALFAILLVTATYKSSKWFHYQALHRVLNSPILFFDTSPLGRILNRFTRDVDSLDLALCDFFRQFYQNISRSIGSFVTIAILVPIFFVPLAPLFTLSWGLIYFYLRTSVEIQRVAAISRSPLYAHYTETLQGLATIRAFDAQNRFIRRIEKALDNANKPHWYSLAVQNWVWLRVDYLSHLLTLIVCLIVIAQPGRWDAAAVGLLLVQATQMGAYVTYAGRGWTELQNNMNSVERINHYATQLDQEPGTDGADLQPEQQMDIVASSVLQPAPSTWPERGTIILRNLSMRYRDSLPLALKEISLEVYDCEKVAIVGRSGAGKSSIVSALFRLVEPSSGRIFIDGVDTQTLSLSRLRQAIGILPQDPVLFDGTLRINLDPFHKFGDSEIWDILEQVCLHSVVSLHPERLEMPVGEGGENLSVGQRQLLCLARVLLCKPNILVLDEATANVDHETDAAIQRVVLSRAREMTVISIAHRLQTIVGYDRVFVIDNGTVVESGTPISLLEQHMQGQGVDGNGGSLDQSDHQQSAFYAMVREMDDDALDSMFARARAAEDRRRAAFR